MRELLGNPLAGPKDRSGPAFSFTNTGVSSILLDGTKRERAAEMLSGLAERVGLGSPKERSEKSARSTESGGTAFPDAKRSG